MSSVARSKAPVNVRAMPPMRISDLIGSLEKVRDYHGDLEVRILNEDGPKLGSIKVHIDPRDRGLYVVLSERRRLRGDRN
jgi:hypothetical protein